jgi:hypothetical protein
MVTPRLHALLEKRLRAQSAISSTQAAVALRCYESEHGSLPESLSELVPRHLPRVPRDYFDGREIRYSREFRAVWSVGKNVLVVSKRDLLLDVNAGEIYVNLATKAR